MFPVYNTLGPFPASTLSFIAVIESENPLNPYVQSWTASVEREIARNTTLEVNYIGTHAVHLLNRRDIAQPFSLSTADQPFCQHKDATGDYDNLGVSPCAPHVADASGNYPRLPYKNFTNFYIDSDFHGYSHYRAVNVKFERRAGDMALTSVYTWANSKDNKSATAGVGASGTGFQGFMDNHNTDLDYGPSDFDVDQRFVSSFIYNLPIGRGKKIATKGQSGSRPGHWRLGNYRHRHIPDRISIRCEFERYRWRAGHRGSPAEQGGGLRPQGPSHGAIAAPEPGVFHSTTTRHLWKHQP